jgi:hypothetical protein
LRSNRVFGQQNRCKPYWLDRPAPPKDLLRVLAQTACAVLKGESNISYSQTKDGSRIRVKVPRQTRRAIEVAKFILRANKIYIARKQDLYFAQTRFIFRAKL